MKKQVEIKIDGEVYLSPEEAAVELGVSTRTVWRWRKEGMIKAVTHNGRALFSRREVKKMVIGR